MRTNIARQVETTWKIKEIHRQEDAQTCKKKCPCSTANLALPHYRSKHNNKSHCSCLVPCFALTRSDSRVFNGFNYVPPRRSALVRSYDCEPRNSQLRTPPFLFSQPISRTAQTKEAKIQIYSAFDITVGSRDKGRREAAIDPDSSPSPSFANETG